MGRGEHAGVKCLGGGGATRSGKVGFSGRKEKSTHFPPAVQSVRGEGGTCLEEKWFFHPDLIIFVANQSKSER